MSSESDAAPTRPDSPADSRPAGSFGRLRRRFRQAGPPGVASLVVIGLVLTVLVIAVWIDTRSQVQLLQQELIRKLGEIDSYNRESRQLATQARDAMRDVDYRLNTLESRVGETQNQRVALEGLYLELSRNRDERVLAEVEQILMIANQQLTLAGNVKSALMALEAADSRLQRSDSAQFAGIRRAVSKDIERLRAVPYVDIQGMSLRLDSIAQEVAQLPLAMDERPHQPAQRAPGEKRGAIRRIAGEAWHDLQSLIRIQRIERNEVPLVSPSQEYFLRENLRMRLISSRVALLAHEEQNFKADTRRSVEWLEQYFDTRTPKVEQTIETLRQMSSAQLRIDIPDISASLEAVRNAKLVRERGLR